MKSSLLIWIMVTLFCSSCTRYQYATIAGTNSAINQNNELVIENDSVQLVYNFNGAGMPVNLSIANKLNEPLQVDWKKSSLIIDDKPHSYFNVNMYVNTTAAGLPAQTFITGTVSRDNGLEFLPPHTRIRRSGLFAAGGAYFELGPFKTDRSRISTGHFSVSAVQADFLATNSPFRFRSFLTFETVTGQPKSFSVDAGFYVSSIIETKAPVSRIWPAEKNSGNKSRLKKASRFGKTAATITGAGLLGLVLAVGL